MKTQPFEPIDLLRKLGDESPRPIRSTRLQAWRVFGERFGAAFAVFGIATCVGKLIEIVSYVDALRALAA